MEHVQAKGVTPEDYTKNFKIKKNDVPRITGKPTYATVKPILDAVETNLINMNDQRDPFWGKLHILQDTSGLVNGPDAMIPESTNQFEPDEWQLGFTHRQREIYLHGYFRDQNNFLDDQAAQEALKEFILSRLDEVYMRELYTARIGYKGVELREFIDLLIDNYEATPEDRADVKKLIEAPWDPNQHIVLMFDTLKTNLETLADMKNVVPYPPADYIEAAYMAIQKTKQFAKACTNWKRKPPGDRATENQLRTYFGDKYEIFDAERDSLHDIGVANNVELQEKLDRTQAQVTAMSSQLVAQNELATKYHAVIDSAMSMTQQTEDTDDTSLSTQMTAFTAAHDQQMATLRRQHQEQLKQCQLTNAGTPPPPIIDVGSSGGRNGGRERTRKGPMSDGPPGTVKIVKYYKECENVCWSHGYDVAGNHHSGNCKYKLKNHVETHTGANPKAGASQKDKQFSKWA